MKRILITVSVVVFLMALLPVQGEAQPFDFGDAPEGALAYPSLGIMGAFPTCIFTGPAGWIQHTNFGAWFGPAFDFEPDGNAGLCPPSGFPPYDQDECFADGDAGLLFPPAYTINATLTVVPCQPGDDGSLGIICQTAVWGGNIDIDVTNIMPNQTVGFVNVLMDWDQNGAWGGASTCPQGGAPEHVLVDWPVPNGFVGPLSMLGPPSFLIGPNPGYVWTRFTITEYPVGFGWTGEGAFEDGETEDYLLLVDPDQQPTLFPVITECPVVETECPVEETRCPVIETECPVSQTLCPVFETECPTGITWCPVVPTECPEDPTHCPVVNTQCPVSETLCPEQGPTICPETETQCPLVVTLCPIQPTFCPEFFTWCPEEPTFCPIMETMCPPDPTFCLDPITSCPIDTFCPEEPTRCFIGPPPITACPEIPTVCPITPVQTECPEIATECPVIPTVCQIIDPTVCPVDPTYCPLIDSDGDGIDDCNDNCPFHPNGPLKGTCTQAVGVNRIVSTGPPFCTVDADCGPGEYCEKWQADTYPPGGNGIGDACDCEGNFDCDADTSVDADDVNLFLADFGRSIYFNPCTSASPCNGDFLCDGDVDADDVTKFLEDFGRSQYNKPCPSCPSGGAWCSYP